MKKYISIVFVAVFVLFGITNYKSALAIVVPPSQGPSNATTIVNDSSVGTYTWLNPDRAKVSNDSWATTTLESSSLRTHYLKATGFGFTIPTGATISGIQVGIERHQTCASDSCSSTVRDNTVKIVKNGTVNGSDYASSSAWPLTDAVATYGTGTSDKWGTTWTAADINNANMGVVLSVERNSGNDRNVYVDNITMTVYYTLAASTTTITPPLTDIPYGTAFSVGAVVTPSDTTGNVDIKEGSTILASATIAGGAGTANISASSSASNLNVGSHSIVGVYGGDTGRSGSTSTPASTINIVKAPTSVEITNSSELSTSSYTKHPYTVKWSVIPSSSGGSGTPTGTVTISGGSGCSASVSAGECDLTSTEAGDKALIATYSGDDNFTGSASVGTPHNVLEDTAPVIDEQADISEVEATSPSGAVVTFTVNSTDVPDGVLPAVCSPASGSTFALGETTVTCSKTDSVGNEAEPISFKVTVVDTTGPVITLNGNNPFDMYINNDYSILNPSPDYTSIDAYDGAVTPIVTGLDFDNTILGSHTITYSATDSHSNNTTITRTVNVVDRNKPIIYRIGGSPLTVEGGTTYSDLGATAVDRDGSDITSLINTVNTVNTGAIGAYTVTYDVTGAELGELTGTNIADQAKRIINVVDTTAPVITVDPTTVELLVGAPYDIKTGVAAHDNVDGDLSSSIVVGGDYSGTGTAGIYTATYDVVDLTGHNATQMSRTINVNAPDEIDPTITSIKATAPSTVEVLFDEALQNNSEGHHPTASDFIVYNDVDKSGDYNDGDTSYGIESVSYNSNKVTITLTNPLKSGDTPRLKITPEETSIVDISGNYFNNGNTYDTPITDKINPVITLNGSNPISITQGTAYVDAGATVTDIFDNAVTVTPNSNVNTSIVGTYTVTYDAMDEAGNEADQVSRTVNVIVPSSHSSGSTASSGGYLPPLGYYGQTGVTAPPMGGQVLGANRYYFTLTLKMGSRGNEVKELQKYLNDLGFDCGPVDGIFGIRTMLAVVKFQVMNGIPATGVVGPLTRAALNR